MSISEEGILNEIINKYDVNAQTSAIEQVEAINQTLLGEFDKRVMMVTRGTRNMGFRADIIQKKAEENVKNFIEFKNKFYDGLIATTRTHMVKIASPYITPPQAPEAELLAFKRYETKVKSLPSKDLEKIAGEFRVSGKGLTADQVYILASELRTRGSNDKADALMTVANELHHVEEPWRADPEYKNFEKALKVLETYRAHEDVLYYTDQKDHAAKLMSLTPAYVMSIVMG